MDEIPINKKVCSHSAAGLRGHRVPREGAVGSQTWWNWQRASRALEKPLEDVGGQSVHRIEAREL